MRNLLKAVAWLCFLPLVSVNASITNQTDKQGPVIVASGFPGVSSQFIVSFPFQQASDLLVLDYGNPSGVLRDPAAILVLGSDYTVSSGGYNAANQMTNGVVTMQTGVNNVLANDYLVIMRNVPLNQITSFTATGPLTITQIEQSLDKMATLSQQVNEVATGRALQFENFEVTGQNSLNAGANVLPLTARKSTLLGFDTNGNPAFYPLATSGSAGIVTGASTSQLVVQANSFVAGEPVTLSNTTWVAATANSTQLASNALGVVSSNGLSGTQFVVVNSGVCPVVGGTFTPGAIYYVPLSAGLVTSTAPSGAGQYVYAVATAESATVLVVGISTPSQVVAFPTLSGNNTWTGTNAFNNTVSGTGFTSLFASPPAIGGTVAAAGSFAALSSTGTTALGGAAGGISTPGMISIGNNTTVSGYALELHGSTPIVANGGSAIQVNTQLTAEAANTYNFENFTPTFNTSTYTGNTLNSINVGTPTVNTTGGGTVTGGYQINVAAPASGQAGALNLTSGAVNLGSGAITSTGSVVLNSATGGSQGAGTINATGLYVNGVSVGGSIVGSNNTWTGTNTFNSTVSGTGITNLFASPPAIGGTSAAAGNFTILNATASSTTTPFTVNGGSLTAGTFASNVTYNASGASIATSGTSDTTTGVRWQTGSVTLDLGTYFSGSTYLQNRAIANYGLWYPILINPAGGNVTLGGSSSTVTVTNALSVGGASTLTGNLTVYGTTTLTTPLAVGQGGTGNATAGAANQALTPATTAVTESANAATFNWASGNFFTITLNGNLNTVTFSNTVDGQTIVVAVTNTASNYTVTWGNSIKWVGGSQPVQTIGAHTDVWTIVDFGGTYYGNAVQNF